MKDNTWHTSELDTFVNKCDKLGGIQSPDAQEFIINFQLNLSTQVPKDIDPKSEEYHNLQV